MATNVNERNVPDTPTNKMFDCLWEARNLSLYTVKICSNTNNFPPEYYQTMTGDMIKKAKDIYRLGKRANAIYVQGKTGHERWEEQLQNDTWINRKPKPIIVTYPKRRECLSIPFRDRVYQRSINDNSLYPQTTKHFVYTNIACQKFKGTKKAMDVMRQYLHRYYINNKTNVGYVGYNPGSQMVQIAGISLLNELDHFIKEKLHCKSFIRYMDDSYLITSDKEKAKQWKKIVCDKLIELGFEPNPKKAKVLRIDKGSMFLGFKATLSKTGKVYYNLSSENIKHERRKLKKQVIKSKKGEITKEEIDASLHSWRSHAELGNTYKLLQRIDAYYANLWKEIKV